MDLLEKELVEKGAARRNSRWHSGRTRVTKGESFGRPAQPGWQISGEVVIWLRSPPGEN